MGIRGYLEVFRRRWRLAALIAVLSVAASAALSLTATPVFTSQASLFFSLQNGDSANELAQGSTFTQNQMASYATLATTPIVLDPVIDQLDLPVTARQLAARMSATTPNDTVILEVSVSDSSAERSAAIANAVAAQLTVAVAEVAPPDATGAPTVRSRIVASAQEPRFQSAPNTRLNVAAGLLIGIVLGAGGALLREVLDTRIRQVDQLRALTEVPVLGSLAPTSGKGLVVNEMPRSAQAEAFRQLRTNLQFLPVDSGSLSMLVTSALPGEGKSTTAANLALALAEVNDRVLLVDADLRRPSLAGKLGIEGAAGLTTVLIGRAAFEDVVQEWGPRGLHVLTSGALPPNPTELLASDAMADLVQEWGRNYDAVVIDTAPLLPVTDALLLSRFVGGTLVVASARLVRRPQLLEALRSLEQVQARLFGVVLNMVAARDETARYGYGTYELATPSARHGTRRQDPPASPPAGPGPRPAARSSGIPEEPTGDGPAEEVDPARDAFFAEGASPARASSPGPGGTGTSGSTLSSSSTGWPGAAVTDPVVPDRQPAPQNGRSWGDRARGRTAPRVADRQDRDRSR